MSPALALLRKLANPCEVSPGRTCPVEPGHVHHRLLVRQLHVLLGDHQLDFIPLLRLMTGTQAREQREKKRDQSLFLTTGRASFFLSRLLGSSASLIRHTILSFLALPPVTTAVGVH